MVSHNTSTSFMALLFAIDFIEKTQKMGYNTPKVRNINNFQKDPRINKYINNRKTHSVNTMNRAIHYIRQPQWRGYSH